ncbi:MAG: 5-formyltetrahydrofolate cyclo-ligase [[Ruminococcus] torques]
MYEDAGTVCCYASFGSEVPTEEIIEESLRRGKCAAVPKVTGKQKMKFALIHSMADLKAGFHGIPEPESVSGNSKVWKQAACNRARSCV